MPDQSDGYKPKASGANDDAQRALERYMVERAGYSKDLARRMAPNILAEGPDSEYAPMVAASREYLPKPAVLAGRSDYSPNTLANQAAADRAFAAMEQYQRTGVKPPGYVEGYSPGRSVPGHVLNPDVVGYPGAQRTGYTELNRPAIEVGTPVIQPRDGLEVGMPFNLHPAQAAALSEGLMAPMARGSLQSAVAAQPPQGAPPDPAHEQAIRLAVERARLRHMATEMPAHRQANAAATPSPARSRGGLGPDDTEYKRY